MITEHAKCQLRLFESVLYERSCEISHYICLQIVNISLYITQHIVQTSLNITCILCTHHQISLHIMYASIDITAYQVNLIKYNRHCNPHQISLYIVYTFLDITCILYIPRQLSLAYCVYLIIYNRILCFPNYYHMHICTTCQISLAYCIHLFRYHCILYTPLQVSLHIVYMPR